MGVEVYRVSKNGILDIYTEAEILLLTPITGQLLYNSTLKCPVFWDGIAWRKVSHSAM